MIKLGVHGYLFTENWNDECRSFLDEAKNLGADVFEIGIGDDSNLNPNSTKLHAEQLGLDLTTGPGGVWPLECDLSSEYPQDRAKGLDWHKKNVDLTASLGAFAYTGAFYGHPGVIKKRRPPADEYRWIAEGLHALAEYGAQQGIRIGIEPMSHFRTHLVNTPSQLMRLMKMAEHDNLRAILDSYHLVTEIRDFSEAIHLVGNKLMGFHACENDRGCPGGGLIPWETIFEALKTTHFEGYMMLETYNSSIGDFSLRRGMFHNVCPNPKEFIQRGFDFIKEGMS